VIPNTPAKPLTSYAQIVRVFYCTKKPQRVRPLLNQSIHHPRYSRLDRDRIQGRRPSNTSPILIK